MQVTVILWKAPDSFSFFKKSSSSISERTIDRGRQQALHLGNPLCRTTWEMGPEMMPCSSSAPGPGPQHLLEQLPQHMRGLNTDLTPEGERVWVWGCWGSWDPSLRLGWREMGSPSVSGRWVLLEGLCHQVKKLQEISILGNIKNDESEKLSYSFWENSVTGGFSSACAAWGSNWGN